MLYRDSLILSKGEMNQESVYSESFLLCIKRVKKLHGKNDDLAESIDRVKNSI